MGISIKTYMLNNGLKLHYDCWFDHSRKPSISSANNYNIYTVNWPTIELLSNSMYLVHESRALSDALKTNKLSQHTFKTYSQFLNDERHEPNRQPIIINNKNLPWWLKFSRLWPLCHFVPIYVKLSVVHTCF